MKKLKLWLIVGVVLSLLVGSSASYGYQALEVDGNGYASIADASQAGLDMGLSDFMLEARVRTSSSVQQLIFCKYASNLGYYLMMKTTGYVYVRIRGASVDRNASASNLAINDGRWHDVTLVVDKSLATGLKLFVNGTEVSYEAQGNPTGVGNIDSTSPFYIGTYDGSLHFWDGLIDCVRVWNFGYGGLPADYATYIAWRATGRNVFLDISEYDSGSWNCYADADRTEKVTDGGLETWDNSTLTNWTRIQSGSSTLNKETSGVHGGSACARYDVVDGAAVYIYQTISYTNTEKHEVKLWVKTDTSDKQFYLRTGSGDGGTLNSTNTKTIATTTWTQYSFVFTANTDNDDRLGIYRSGTGNFSLYFDDISVKRTGLVGHWKFEGDYTDETTNSNTLTAGGSGNVFPGYTLKRQKILGPAWVR